MIHRSAVTVDSSRYSTLNRQMMFVKKNRQAGNTSNKLKK